MAEKREEPKKRVVEVGSADDWKAAASAAGASALAQAIPGLNIPFAAYEKYKQQRQEKAYREFQTDLQSRVEMLEDRSHLKWLETEDGETYAGKVMEAALDAQMGDKREFFANALISGATTGDLSFAEKTKFVDLLRGLSRAALDALAKLHEKFSPALKQPGRGLSTQISPSQLAVELAEELRINPYLVEASIRELSSAGLFASHSSYIVSKNGSVRSGGSYGGADSYTEFTARFVEFVRDQ